MDGVQGIINRINQGDFDEQELHDYLGSSYILVKANAISAILRCNITSKDILERLYAVSLNINQESKVIGVWTNGHLATAVLKLLNTYLSMKFYEKSVRQTDENTKNDIKRLIEQLPNML